MATNLQIDDNLILKNSGSILKAFLIFQFLRKAQVTAAQFFNH